VQTFHSSTKPGHLALDIHLDFGLSSGGQVAPKPPTDTPSPATAVRGRIGVMVTSLVACTLLPSHENLVARSASGRVRRTSHEQKLKFRVLLSLVMGTYIGIRLLLEVNCRLFSSHGERKASVYYS